jgi:hypothetical protein
MIRNWRLVPKFLWVVLVGKVFDLRARLSGRKTSSELLAEIDERIRLKKEVEYGARVL